MANPDDDIVLRLMQDMGSPQVVTAIDRALDINKRQREDLLDLRKMALRRHGEGGDHPTVAPEIPVRAVPASSLTMNDLIGRYKSDPNINILIAHFQNTRAL